MTKVIWYATMRYERRRDDVALDRHKDVALKRSSSDVSLERSSHQDLKGGPAKRR
jgi:hypothetical protein